MTQLISRNGFGNDSHTKLLIHSNTTNGSTTFTDSSNGGSTHTISTLGSVQHSTTQQKFGTTSMQFSAGSDLNLADHADFAIGYDDFCIDTWIYPTALSGTQILFEHYSGPGWDWFCTGTGLRFWSSTGIDNTVGAVFTNNNWHHVAVTKKGSTVYQYINGIYGGSTGAAVGVASPASGTVMTIGGRGASLSFVGFMDEIRFTKGTARWWGTKNFTPPNRMY